MTLLVIRSSRFDFNPQFEGYPLLVYSIGMLIHDIAHTRNLTPDVIRNELFISTIIM